MEIEGDNSEAFVERLSKEAPPLSQIVSIDVSQLPYHGYQDFKILESEDEGSFTLISADVSVCQDCFREMLNRKDRRYLYPFINCTNCGPRYTITKSVPYDRPNTTMSVFKMCPDCKREYHDPSDRRFHAQPNACPVCGPQVELKGNPSLLLPLYKGRKGGVNAPSPLVGGGFSYNPTLVKGGKGGFVDHKSPVQETIKLLKQG